MKQALLTTIAAIAFSSSTSAFEAGKMYMKTDLGYNFSTPRLSEKVANEKDDVNAIFKNTESNHTLKGFASDITFGYSISDNIRTDVTLRMSHGDKQLKDVELNRNIGIGADAVAKNQYSDINGKNYVASGTTNAKLLKSKVSLKEKNIGLISNIYYHFNSSSEFTPYINAGIGIQRGLLESKVDGYKYGTSGELQTSDETIKSDNLTGLIYQLGSGLSYEMSKDVFLDVGYKVSGNTGKYDFKTKENSIDPVINGITRDDKIAEPKLQQTVTAGVRFAF